MHAVAISQQRPFSSFTDSLRSGLSSFHVPTSAQSEKNNWTAGLSQTVSDREERKDGSSMVADWRRLPDARVHVRHPTAITTLVVVKAVPALDFRHSHIHLFDSASLGDFPKTQGNPLRRWN